MCEYKVFHHPDLGYCAELYNEEGRFWQQVSFWYHSLANLNRYWASKHGFTFAHENSHVFI